MGRVICVIWVTCAFLVGALLGVRFLSGSTCAEGISCERRWVRWVLRGTGTASGHPGVS